MRFWNILILYHVYRIIGCHWTAESREIARRLRAWRSMGFGGWDCIRDELWSLAPRKVQYYGRGWAPRI